jgi:hypothetical protein
MKQSHYFRVIVYFCCVYNLADCAAQWIDTCCIDKTSSAELSEAINSMFQWYRNAEVCYAYLSDVKEKADHLNRNFFYFKRIEGMWVTVERIGETEVVLNSHRNIHSSQWFTRGWTLQELLAPRNVVFFNYAWDDIGTRTTLNSHICDITGITDLSRWERASIAQKMSWAAYRNTTRVEDRAYCLMGLFGINMPLLYGEGERAFVRLQLQILEQSDDESLFAWEHYTQTDTTSGLLASSPFSFRNSGDVIPQSFISRPPYSMTNRGLRMDILDSYYGGSRLQTPINCARQGHRSPLAIYLSHVSGEEKDRYQRVEIHELVEFNPRISGTPTSWGTVYIKQKALSTLTDISIWPPDRSTWIQEWDRALIRAKDLQDYGYSSSIFDVWSNQTSTWDKWFGEAYGEINLRFKRNGSYGMVFTQGKERIIILLQSLENHLGARVLIPFQNQSLNELAMKLVLEESPDRVSQCLPSGKSISVIVKKGLDLGQPCYFVDIKVHDNGRLQWPRRRNDYEFRVSDKPSSSNLVALPNFVQEGKYGPERQEKGEEDED